MNSIVSGTVSWLQPKFRTINLAVFPFVDRSRLEACGRLFEGHSFDFVWDVYIDRTHRAALPSDEDRRLSRGPESLKKDSTTVGPDVARAIRAGVTLYYWLTGKQAHRFSTGADGFKVSAMYVT